MQGYCAELVTAQLDGTALANSVAATSLLPGQANFTIPAGFLEFIGQELIVEASGRISTLTTTPGTLQFSITLSGITVALSPAFALNVNAKSNVTWWLRWALTLRAVGHTTANFMHTGYWMSEAVIGSPTPAVGGSGLLLIPASAPAVGSNFSNDVANQVLLLGQWSVADPANSIQLQQFRIFSPN